MRTAKRVIMGIATLAILFGVTMLVMQFCTPYKPSNGFKKAETTTTQAVGVGVKTIVPPIGFPIADGRTGTATVNTNSGDYEVSYSCSVKTRTTSGFEGADGSVSGQKTYYSVTLTVDTSSLPTYSNFEMVMDNDLTGWTHKSSSTGSETYYVGESETAYKVDYLNFHFTATVVNYIPLPEAPTKEGYTFTGWYTDEACTNKYEGETVREDVTLYAGWEINTYTVTYDANGGSACESVTVNWNTAPTLPTTTRIGYTFLGWFDGDTQYTDAPVKADTTLTAHWEILTFTVTFMSDGQVYKTMTVEYGTSLQAAMQTAQIASYAAMTAEGVKLSKQNSVITENTEVLVKEQTGWEKYGDFVARSPWYTWTILGVGVIVLATAVICIVILTKKR